MAKTLRLKLAGVILSLLVYGCATKVNVQPPKPNLTVTDFVYANVGKPVYNWFTADGAIATYEQDVQISPTQFTRYTLAADNLSGVRSDFALVDGWLQPTQEVSVIRSSVDGEWHEYGWQVYAGAPQQFPTIVTGNGTVYNEGRWAWHDDNGNMSAGGWAYRNTWTWDGTTLVNHEWWQQSTDGNPSPILSDRMIYFTKAGLVKLHDLPTGFTVCMAGIPCTP